MGRCKGSLKGQNSHAPGSSFDLILASKEGERELKAFWERKKASKEPTQISLKEPFFPIVG